MSIDDRLVTLLIYHYIFIFVLPYTSTRHLGLSSGSDRFSLAFLLDKTQFSPALPTS
jgi:hypothetical protein